ncbi:MAG: DUF1918 domain-containing protein [Halolamina sp.]|uniref:DUF1918 domain-containing protein n=1 Tax=Halolamina sp. TaxID=1940283 RepID=UPI002FC2F670
MSYEKGDTAILHDEHSEFDGKVGEITQVMETMFGDPNYTIVFDGGQEAGIPEDQLEAAPDAEVESEEDAEDDEDDEE